MNEKLQVDWLKNNTVVDTKLFNIHQKSMEESSAKTFVDFAK
jgi:hypothetical protein